MSTTTPKTLTRVQINGIRISVEHHEQLVAIAERNRRSLSAEAAVLLERSIEIVVCKDERSPR